jgi:FkbM family methyltransferase
MKNILANFVKTKPHLFDIAKRVCRVLSLSRKDDAYKFFDNFSRLHNRHVTFVQIGASDGLRWDPIREFIVRDGWEGILVEPLPAVYEILKHNYGYVQEGRLVFVNAAISSNAGNLVLWTLDDEFLSKLSLEERIIYSQKSSFSKEHVLRWIRLNKHQDRIVKAIKIPCVSLNELMTNHWDRRPINLLVIDAEGHEASIIQGIDFNVINPEVIFFESHNLGVKKGEVYKFLSMNHYEINELGGDTVASRTVDCVSPLR